MHLSPSPTPPPPPITLNFCPYESGGSVVDSLFIVTHIVGVLCLFLVLLCNTFMPFLVCNHVYGDEKAGFFTLVVFPMHCDCFCSVTHPHGPVG